MVSLLFGIASIACREQGAAQAQRKAASSVGTKAHTNAAKVEPATEASCPFERNAYRPLTDGASPEALGPAAAMWMTGKSRPLRMIVPSFTAPFMSVATAHLSLHDPTGRFLPGLFSSPRRARLDIADFRKRRMTADSEPTEGGLGLEIDVHQRLSDRICLTLRVTGVVAFELQLQAPIVAKNVEATLWGQGIHRGLLKWPQDLPYETARRANALGALCPPRGRVYLSAGGRSVDDVGGRLRVIGEHHVLRLDAGSLGALELRTRSSAPSSTLELRHERPEASWTDVTARGHMYVLKDGVCGAFDLPVAGSRWHAKFHIPRAAP